MAIRIDFLSNTRDFLKGANDVDGALDKVGGSLDGLASDTKATSTKIGEDFQGSASKIEKSFKEMAAEAKAQTDSVTGSVRRSEREQTQAIELSAREKKKLRREGLKETADQAKLAAAQSASSIDGTLGGLSDAVTGASIGVLASLPPQFALVGAAGVAALGVVTGQLTRGDEATQAFKKQVADLTAQFIGAGNEGHRSISDYVDELQKLAENTDTGATSLKDLQKVSKELGVPLKEVVFAYERGGSALDDLIEKTHKLQKAETARYDKSVTNDPNKVYGPLVDGADHYNQHLADVNDTLTKQQDALKAAAVAAALAAAAGLSDYQLKADLVNQLGKSYDDAAGDVQDYIVKESGLLDVGAYIAAMAAKQKALDDYQADLASSGLSPEAKKFLESQGADAAATFLAGYEGASAGQKDQLNQIWTAAGKASAGNYADALTKNLPASVKGPAVTVDTSGAEAQLAGLSRGKAIVVKATIVDRYGKALQ